MRKLNNQAIIWPVYFDVNKSRAEGRRVNRSQAVVSPKITEIKEAADKLGIENEINLEAHFPKAHWSKCGMLIVAKKEPKEDVIQRLAKQLFKIRQQQPQQTMKR
jgi:Signal recognition particle 19 kDa protein